MSWTDPYDYNGKVSKNPSYSAISTFENKIFLQLKELPGEMHKTNQVEPWVMEIFALVYTKLHFSGSLVSNGINIPSNCTASYINCQSTPFRLWEKVGRNKVR